MHSYSFDIVTARDLYLKLKREHTKFQAETTNSDLAWNCAVTAWHLREWFWKEQLSVIPGEDLRLFGQTFASQEEYSARLNATCPKYKLLHAICNGSKHFSFHDAGEVNSTGVRPGALFGGAMFGEVMFEEGPYLAIYLKNNTIVRFSEVINQVVIMWDGIFSGSA